MRRPEFTEKLKSIPASPGVYIMKNADGRVIYVGKGIVLRNRVRSYFQDSAAHTPKVTSLVAEIADIEWIVTDSELEALILECTLIKKHRPRYNVRLKDDKRYPYIKITEQDDYARIFMTRYMTRDGARYFGPYTSAKAVRRTLEHLRHIFPYLSCQREITGKDDRPCLYYHIHRCPGPCIGAISTDEYHSLIQQIILFLEGKQERIITDLRVKMVGASDQLDFERAAELRDRIDALERVVERQKVVSATLNDHDVLAFARDDGQACVQVFLIRGGKLVGREYFVLTGAQDEDAGEIMTSFLTQFYDEAAHVPKEILLQSSIDEMLVIEEWLRSKRGTKVTLRVPRRGQKRELMAMATKNAEETLAALRMQWESDTNKHVTALGELQEYLALEGPPSRIEAYDISNIQGVSATGSMVVFAKGVPRKSDYRRFRIKTVFGANDYAMMQEVLRRRFKRAVAKRKGEADVTEKAGSWAVLPDLLIVDGGKGQLNAALEVLDQLELKEAIPVVGLAKKHEEVFLPNRAEAVMLPRTSEALYLLQRIRDEAHRFAISYHRKLRQQNGRASILEEIPGVGAKRRRALLKHFGSIEAIAQAPVEDLMAVNGMNRKVAKQVKEYL